MRFWVAGFSLALMLQLCGGVVDRRSIEQHQKSRVAKPNFLFIDYSCPKIAPTAICAARMRGLWLVDTATLDRRDALHSNFGSKLDPHWGQPPRRAHCQP